MNRTLAFVTLLLVALGLGPGLAHVLEMPVKLRYSPQLYTAVNSTMYAWYGKVGTRLQPASIGCAIAWAVASRGMPLFRSTVIGAVLLAASLLAWALLVQ